jgi:hypothetical protein
MLDSVNEQIEKVKAIFQLETNEKPDGSIQILVKDMLTHGNGVKADIVTVLPANYPQTMPAGFSIRNPDSTLNGICYRPSTWDPTKDNLWKWIRMIAQYLKENPQ